MVILCNVNCGGRMFENQMLFAIVLQAKYLLRISVVLLNFFQSMKKV